MPSNQSTPIARFIDNLVAEHHLSHLTDRELLRRFTKQREEAAFLALLKRHGTVIQRICRRTLSSTHDADDIFQATFLVLLKKAPALRWRESIASWLHEVAYRLAIKTRNARIRRGIKESQASFENSSGDPLNALTVNEAQSMLHEELNQLPETLRGPLVLCYLENATQEEAARQLGWSLRTLKRRLQRGRDLLHKRLTRRGLTLSAALSTSLLASSPASATLIRSTLAAAVSFTSGKAGTIAAPVAVLVQGALGSMFLTKVKVMAVLVMCLVCTGILLTQTLPGLRIAEAAGTSRNSQSLNKDEKTANTVAAHPAVADGAAKEKKVIAKDVYGDPLPPGALARLGTIRFRPGGNVWMLAFSPNGTRLVSWSGRLSIWDTATGKELRQVSLSGARLLAISWLAENEGIAVLDLGASHFYIWNFTDPEAKIPLIQGRDSAMIIGQGEDLEHYHGFTISPNGKLLAAGKSGYQKKDRPIYIWELPTGRRLEELKEPRLLGHQTGNCDALAFTPDSKSLLVFSDRPVLNTETFKKDKAKGEKLGVWDLATGRQSKLMTIPQPVMQGDRQVHAVAPDGKSVALGMSDGTVRMWDMIVGKEMRSLEVMKKDPNDRNTPVWTLAFSSDGHLLTSSDDNLIRIWDRASGQEARTLKGHFGLIETLAVSADGKRLASAGQDGLIRIWDVATGVNVGPHDSHEFWVGNVAVSPDGKTTATGSLDGTLRIWDTETGRLRHPVNFGDRGPGSMAFTTDGILVSNRSGKLGSWQVATGEIGWLPANLTGLECDSFRLGPDRKELVTARGHKISIWDWRSGQLSRTWDLPIEKDKRGRLRCESLAVAADGRTMAIVTVQFWEGEVFGFRQSSAGQGAVDIWDNATGQRVRRLLSSTWHFNDAAFAPDGSGLVIATSQNIPIDGFNEPPGLDNSLMVMDFNTGKKLRTITVPGTNQNGRRSVRNILFSPDGRTLATTEGNAILIFEWATGLVRQRLRGHRSEVSSIAYTPDGKCLISGSLDHTALVWDVSFPALGANESEEPARSWEGLGKLDADAVNRALGALARNPKVLVDLASKHIVPATVPGDATLERLVAELGSEVFAAREKAGTELDRFGEMAYDGLYKLRPGVASLETRKRIERLLEKHDPSKLGPDRLLQIRTLEILEQIRSPEALHFLDFLARGAPKARLTKDAKAALDRLKSQQANQN